jgi:Flp pilus assembly protein TadG
MQKTAAAKEAHMNEERGQSLILFAFMLAVIVGITGLVTDVGFLMRDRNHLQSSVDAAALAGASGLPNATTAKSLANQWAAKNGLTANGVTLTVTTPYNGDSNKILVTAQSTRKAYFTQVLGVQFFDVGARAVASMKGTSGIQAAMLALNPTKCKAINKSGSSNIVINNNGGIMANSSCNPSIDVSGTGKLTAAAVYYNDDGGYHQTTALISPAPQPLPDPIQDPLKNVTPPNVLTTLPSINSGGTALTPAKRTISSGNVTINPGTYFGGLEIKGNGTKVTMNPGVYIMAGGGFTVSSGSPSITGSGVMVYNTYDPWKNSGAGACASIDLSGGGTWNYTPPSSGTYKGIGLWQDKACTNDVKLVGGNGGPSGAIYAPTARVNMSGSGSLGSIQIIADSFDITGSGNMTVDFVPWIDIPLTPSIRLIE